MKKILLAACVFVLAACGGAKDGYRNALPKDALVVAGFNPKSLGDKMNAKDFANSNLGLMLSKMMTNDGLDEADRQFLMSLISDPKQSGLSMADDIYMFVSNEKTVGILAKVDNRNKVSETIEKAGQEVIEESGKFVAGDLENGTAIAIYDDNVFLFYVDEANWAEMSPKVHAMMAQKATDGLMGTKAVADALTGGNDFSVVLNYTAMMNMMEDLPNGTSAMMGMSTMKEMKSLMDGANYIMTGNFEKGRIASDMHVVFADKEKEKKYFDFAAKLVGKMNGSALKYVPENSLIAVAANIKGAGLYEMMATVPEFSNMAAQMAPVKTVMEAIEGDITMALTGYDAANKMPSFVMFVELVKPDVVTGYLAMASAMGAKSDGENRWVLDAGKTIVRFGIHNKMLYATNDEASYAALNGTKMASIDGKYGTLFKGYGSMVIDFAGGGEALKAAGVDIEPEIMPLLELFDKLEISSAEMGKTHIVLTTSDKGKNAAEVIYTTVQAMARIATED